jgi:hypothetical protein
MITQISRFMMFVLPSFISPPPTASTAESTNYCISMYDFVDSAVEAVGGGEMKDGKTNIMKREICVIILLPLFLVTDYTQTW